ncbi:MAG TPA: LysR family transcriptional regulator [Candidatus Copromorpha excrementigallinarum]|uniref:LysR family transcriptional regulator n=1 Tax=Candidatus Allocopromorpha excrementigallinarum TaxID=2840742 RepID=A0A9D1I0R6_9FIRM|nr:LysR family transcriptional regulator [Candidatus Copromorpha excrementigallinarum]
MDLRVLRYFLAVVREESISGAADFLHITQPTLSRQIMELEEELGVRLLNRGRKNHKITLTEEGALLRRRAEELIALADKTKSELSSSVEAVGGDVFIGGGETEAIGLIAKAAGMVRGDHPNVCFHLYSGNGDDVTERLDSGLLDIGVFVGSVNLEKYHYIHLPVTDSWGLLTVKDSPPARKRVIKAEDLKELPLIASRQSMVFNELSGWCGCDFQSLSIVATYNLIYNASLMVEEGLGHALCLEGLINTEGTDLRFIPLDPPLKVHLNVAWKKHRPLSKAAEKFLQRLQELLRS